MDQFIIQNATWFENMGVAVVIFSVFAVIFFVLAIAFKIQKTNLKSRKKRSAFARTYAGIAVSNVDNNRPMQRLSESNMVYHRKRNIGESMPNNQQQNMPQNMANGMPQNKTHNYGNHVIEVDFVYEDEYKL